YSPSLLRRPAHEQASRKRKKRPRHLRGGASLSSDHADSVASAAPLLVRRGARPVLRSLVRTLPMAASGSPSARSSGSARTPFTPCLAGVLWTSDTLGWLCRALLLMDR